MATIAELESLMLEIPGVSPETANLIIAELRRTMPGEKLYIPAPETSKREAIERASKTLPTIVVAERLGVTRQYVDKVRRGVRRKPKN